MKYTHPVLKRREVEYMLGSYVIVYGPRARIAVTENELLALGFEPVKEEIPEWIGLAYKDYRDMENFDKNNPLKMFNDCIIKHMPKQEQQKITIDELDIVQGMKDHFEKVEEEAEGIKATIGEDYYYINSEGEVNDIAYECDELDMQSYEYGNYYKSFDAAQAVADLRKHVYKFPISGESGGLYCIVMGEGIWVQTPATHDSFSPYHISETSTEEDRAERLRLIDNCIKEVGYLTI